MKARNLICKLFMLLLLIGVFEINSTKEYYAEMNYSKVLDGTNDIFDITEETTYLINPKETGIYSFALKPESDEGAFATLFNEKNEVIATVLMSSEDPIYIYLKSSKEYYLKLSKDTTYSTFGGKGWIKFQSKTYKGTSFDTDIYAEDKLIYSTSGLHYLDMGEIYYDEETRTLEINNFNGTSPIKILMNNLNFVADSDDVDGKNTINIKIIGENSITLSNDEYEAIRIYANVRVNIIGDGVLNVKLYNEDHEKFSSYNVPRVITGNCNSVVFNGPTLNVEETCGEVIDVYDNLWRPIGSVVFKSGTINVNKCTDSSGNFASIIKAAYVEISGGLIRVNYEYAEKARLISSWDKATIFSLGDIRLKNGKIIVTGNSNIISRLDTIGAYSDFGDQVKNISIIKAEKINIEDIESETDKTENKYDEKSKTTKATIDSLKEEVKLGSKITDGNLIYKVTKEGTSDGKTVGNVTVVGLKKKLLKKVSIKSILTINGVKYKVTAIGKKAFKNGKKLKSIVIGKNVSKIGKGAFAGCKKLKSIKIKSKKIKKFVKGTFKGLKKSCVIKVPKAKKKVYAKKIKKAGFKGIVK
ncbi:leucine-rich repeat protein [Eubacterium sp.]|uniref:leucine-rich repeat protein n=1 Tax=Eubacterium sp. TaxID=142586 RepID=UPI0025E5C9FC|nr:leucine-rich repeat protein [Eubacterium sp.]MCR5628155.1 leucine-rich repeat domain-containing protein [Eubacterium sp.]